MARSSAPALAAGAVLLALGGCAGLQHTLPPTAKLDPNMGYVAGRFEQLQGTDFGFALYDEQDVQHRITFGELQVGVYTAGAVQHDLVGLTPLPPGDYRLGGWIHGPGERPFRAGSALLRPFHLEPGHVVFIGTFDAIFTSQHLGNVIHQQWSLQPHDITADQVVTVLRARYPAFAEAPVECILCSAPSASAPVFAMPAQGASASFGSRTTVIHFHPRREGQEGWQLTAWESFQRPEDLRLSRGKTTAPDRVLPGTPPEHRMNPDGVDDFGPRWKLLDKAFRNGRVNFTVYRGSVVDMQGRFWLVPDSPEGWVNEGDPKVYLSRAEAEAALKK